MRKRTTLTKRQIEVIEDLLTTELKEKGILKKHNVSPKLYTQWHSDKTFVEYFEKRIAAAHRSNAARIAGNAERAAEKLLELTKGDKGETARKACLDIIAMQETEPPSKAASEPATRESPPQPPEQPRTIPPKTAEKILAILAEEQEADNSNPG